MKKLITAFFIICSFHTYAQFPIDLPGSLQIDIGFNKLIEAPLLNDGTELPLKFFASKGVNIYYMYEIRLGHDSFTFHPGFGVGLQNYRFDDKVVVGKAFDGLTFLESTDINLKKSKLTANYFDIPLEFRFRSNTGRKAFRAGIGGKVGFLFDSHTKVKTKDDGFGDSAVTKNKTKYYMENVRYGLTGRVGFGNLDAFVYYNLSDVFESDKLLFERSVKMVTFGFTLHGL